MVSFDLLPNELKLKVFKHLSVKELLVLRNSFSQLAPFTDPKIFLRIFFKSPNNQTLYQKQQTKLQLGFYEEGYLQKVFMDPVIMNYEDILDKFGKYIKEIFVHAICPNSEEETKSKIVDFINRIPYYKRLYFTEPLIGVQRSAEIMQVPISHNADSHDELLLQYYDFSITKDLTISCGDREGKKYQDFSKFKFPKLEKFCDYYFFEMFDGQTFKAPFLKDLDFFMETDEMVIKNLNYPLLVNFSARRDMCDGEETTTIEFLNVSFGKTLKSFECTGNIVHFPNFSGCDNLENFDVFQSNLIQIPDLNQGKSLKSISMELCQVKKISNLSLARNLRLLNLGENNILKIENLDNLTNLENLILQNNCISKIENLSSLIRLRKLNLQGNAIKKIEGLEGLSNLEHLHLDHNSLTKIEGLDELINLKHLSAVGNQLVNIDGLVVLKKLEVLKLSKNKIRDLKIILEHFKNLEQIDYYENPSPDSSAFPNPFVFV